MNRVRKAILPAAGLGTRFLPATKTVPKEMLTVVDAPIIYYVVEEAAKAGITDIILIQGRGKTAIEDFFDVSHELETKLIKDGKEDLLKNLVRIRSMVNLVSIRQKEPLGLGHAVMCAKNIIGDEAFAVLLADEILKSKDSGAGTTEKLIQHCEQNQKSCLAVMKVSPTEISKYGVIQIEHDLQSYFRLKTLVEKPKKDSAPSPWAVVGRYVLMPEVFEHLESTRPGINGEIQLTDALASLAKSQGIDAIPLTDRRFDAGDKLGYLLANIEFGLENPETSEGLRKYLANLKLN